MNKPEPTPTDVAPATSNAASASIVELECGCVDLLCKMEFYVSEINDCDPADRYEIAIEVARKMICCMEDFSTAFFIGQALSKTNKEIRRANSAAEVMETLIANRSFGGLILRTFGGTDPNEDTFREANRNLFKAIKRGIVTLLFHVIQQVGFDSPLGKQLDQSTLLFVSELETLY